MKRLKSYIIFALFCGMICMPFGLKIIKNLTGKTIDCALSGYFDATENPNFTLEDFFSGDYQKKYESYLNATILPRATYIKIYNQLRYTFFNLGTQIVGKNKDLFEEKYIVNELGLVNDVDFSIPENQEKLEHYIEKVQSIQDKLALVDKTFLLYTTPTKTQYKYEDIPNSYIIRKNNSALSGIDYLNKLIKQHDINYVDARTIIEKKSHDYPVFYKSGIHWARPAEQLVSQNIIETLSKLSGKKLRGITLTNLKQSDQPFWRDADLLDLLNVYMGYPKEKYYEYDIELQNPKEYDPTHILVQGGSFAQGLEHDVFSQYSDDQLYYINYKNSISDLSGNYIPFNEWDELDLKKYLDQVDFVVIELNDAAIHNESSGFVEYLDQYLDEYIRLKQNSLKY